jgi:hypothetical protein
MQGFNEGEVAVNNQASWNYDEGSKSYPWKHLLKYSTPVQKADIKKVQCPVVTAEFLNLILEIRRQVEQQGSNEYYAVCYP